MHAGWARRGVTCEQVLAPIAVDQARGGCVWGAETQCELLRRVLAGVWVMAARRAAHGG